MANQTLQIKIGGDANPFITALDRATTYALQRTTNLRANAARFAQEEAAIRKEVERTTAALRAQDAAADDAWKPRKSTFQPPAQKPPGLLVAGLPAMAGNLMAKGLSSAASLPIKLISDFIEKCDEIDEAAQRIGIGTEALQRLQHAATQSGASTEQLDAAFKTMANVVTEGGKSAETSMASLGLKISDLRAMTPEQQFDTIAKALAGVENASLRSKLAMDMFGKSGTFILPMAADLDRLKAAANVIPDDTIKAVGTFRDSMSSMWTSTQAFVGQSISNYQMMLERIRGVDEGMEAVGKRNDALAEAEQQKANQIKAVAAAQEAATAAAQEANQKTIDDLSLEIAKRLELASIAGTTDPAAEQMKAIGPKAIAAAGHGDLKYGQTVIEAQVAAAEKAAAEKKKLADETATAEKKAAADTAKAVEEAKEKEIKATKEAAAEKIKAARAAAMTATDAAKAARAAAVERADASRARALLPERELRNQQRAAEKAARDKAREDRKIDRLAQSAQKKLADGWRDPLTRREQAALQAVRDRGAARQAGGVEAIATKQLATLDKIFAKIDKIAGCAP